MRRILILDDQADVGATLSRMSVKLGHEALSTTLLSAFVEYLSQWQPSDIILDLQMPEADGLDVLDILKSNNFDGNIYLCTGAGEKVAEAVRRAGNLDGIEVRGILQKPFRFADFETILMRKKVAEEPLPVKAKSENVIFTAQQVRHIIDHQSYEVFYQPKVFASNFELAGFEALLRIHHSEAGMVPPSNFIDLAEKGGVLHDLSIAIIGRAIEWASRVLKPLQLSISINISPGVLLNNDFLEKLDNECKKWDVDPGYVILEITEGLSLANIPNSLSSITKLRMAGFGVALDDFGIGYSSFAQISDYPFSEIKIDRKFISMMLTSDEANVIVRSAITIGNQFGLKITAEGVESEEVAQALGAMNCDMLQGYLINQAMSADTAEKWIDERQKTRKLAQEHDINTQIDQAVSISETDDEKLLVCLIDDETDVRQTLVRGLGNLGLKCHPFNSGNDFLEALDFIEPDCALLDLRMPDLDGIEVLRALRDMELKFPVIMFTSHGDIEHAVSAMKLGAVEFIEKPCSLKIIEEKIRQAVSRHREHMQKFAVPDEFLQGMKSLTKRESEIADMVIDGHGTNQISENLNINIRTVETHRYNIYKKTKVSNVRQLILLHQRTFNIKSGNY